MENRRAMRLVLVISILLSFCAVRPATAQVGADPALEEADALNSRVMELYQEGKYEEAIPLAEEVLRIREELLGADDPTVATSLNNLAALYYALGRYAEAEPLYLRALQMDEKSLGKDHPDVALALNNLAALYEDMGRYAEAEPIYLRALQIREKTLGKDHPDVAVILNNLALLYKNTGRHAEAEPLYLRALGIKEQSLGKDHPAVATSLNNLAMLLKAMGRYAEVEPLYLRALEIFEKSLGKDHPDVAAGLNNLAQLYVDMGRHAEAEQLFKRALEITESALGKDHPYMATSLSNLALLYVDIGRHAEAEQLFRRALEITEKSFGRNHPYVARSLNNLAILYMHLGRYAEAEPLYKRALEIVEKSLGKDHPYVATCLNNLALLYADTTRYAEAEPLFRKALEIIEKLFGKNHPDVATSLNNLALLYVDTGRHAEAEPLYRRTLEIYEKTLGKDHHYVASGLNNLAMLLKAMGRYSEAEPLYLRALKIYEKSFGRDHHDVALGLNNLAVLYKDTGRYAEAEPLYLRALKIYEKSLGKEHPNVATGLTNLAGLYVAMGKHKKGHEFLSRGLIAKDSIRESIFPLLSDRQKIDFMKQTQWNQWAFVAHSAQFMAGDGRALTDTLDSWLRWKGAVMEAQGRYMDAVYSSEDPEIQKVFDELMDTRREIARLQLFRPEHMSPEEYKKRIDELTNRKEALEAELSRLSKDFALEKTTGKADVGKLAGILGEDSVYIDFANIDAYDFTNDRWGGSRYFVFVLLPRKEPVVKLLDIAATEEIDGHIEAYLKEMRRPERDKTEPRLDRLRQEARALYEKVIEPIEQYLQGRSRLYISPDGNLNLIPFEVFVTAEGKYLMEDFLIDYIGAGRDIVRFEDTAVAQGNAVIMADPDYDLALEERPKIAKALGKELRGAAPVSRGLKGLWWPRLPDTKTEADKIEKVLEKKRRLSVRNYQGKEALEEVLYEEDSPAILHLATHGYFLEDEQVEKQDRPGGFSAEGPGMGQALNIENPMLRSGLVLAGANSSLKENRDDGLVSAEKILGLELKGTELVVLSACNTGVGDVKSGEGVFGLKRSFILSGAKTLVMSLWSVPSRETTELMVYFYTKMAGGSTKAEALRSAKMDMMANNPNPFYWGAFVMVGNPE